MVGQSATTGSNDGKVLVCGGACVDCIVRPFDSSQRGASRTSLPGRAKVGCGGVGRNIAESLARLGGSPRLLSAVGDDDAATMILDSCRGLGVGVDALARVKGGRTATFTGLLDGTGELVGGIADMDIFEEVTPDIVRAAKSSFTDVGLVICDGNLSEVTVEQVSVQCAEVGAHAWFEPVSVAKAARGRCPRPWHLVSPNWDELLVMLGRKPTPSPFQKVTAATGALPTEVLNALEEAMASHLAEHVLLTMGPMGVVLASAQASASSSTAGVANLEIDIAGLLAGVHRPSASIPPLAIGVERGHVSSTHFVRYRLLRPADSVVDVTGAGDAVLAGAARAFTQGWPLENAIIVGMVCAHLTIFDEGAVCPFLHADLISTLEKSMAFPPSSRL